MAGFGLNPKLEYVELLLDSEDASFPCNGSVQKENWPVFQLSRPLSNVAGIKILEVQIPFSFYVFDDSRVSTLITFTEVSRGTTTFKIPDGNYNSSSLAAVMKSLLDAASVSLGAGSRTYTVSFSSSNSTTPYTGKMTVTASTGTFQLSFTQDPTTNVGVLLGFNTNIQSTYTSVSQVITSTQFNQITGPNYLYVNSLAMGSLCNTYLPAGATAFGGQFPQITKIPVNVQPGGVIYWSDPAPDYFYSLENLLNLSQIDLYLTLGNMGGLLDLHGISFSVKLGILINKDNKSEFVGGSVTGGRVLTRNY
jgi:hypothetical protein